jgi:hypothetical protein
LSLEEEMEVQVILIDIPKCTELLSDRIVVKTRHFSVRVHVLIHVLENYSPWAKSNFPLVYIIDEKILDIHLLTELI